ncbi:hypothetical protein TCAL_14233 [Tigriopus californicus]|uniref:MYND-type domain-containing protein n=1 Tax=Tigriopus californicus TaxID=6832 RepID=A0A553NUV5_TIGCA|nr:hypothetical protein TCAL_14233 [Tigriopus californicus]
MKREMDDPLEVKALQYLARRKEQEWDQIVNLLKRKEVALLKSEKAWAMNEGPRAAQLMGSVVKNGSGPPATPSSIVIPGEVGSSFEIMPEEDSNASLPVISSVRTQPVPEVGESPAGSPSPPPTPARLNGTLCQFCLNHVSKFMCAGCSNRWYCTKDCQIKDWDTHADLCS